MANPLQYISDSGRSLDALFLDAGSHKDRYFLFDSFGLTPNRAEKLFAQFQRKRDAEYEKWEASQPKSVNTSSAVPDPSVTLKAVLAPKADEIAPAHESLQTKIEESVLVARPLKELSLFVKNLKLPSFALIARCIKTLVLGIFRKHLSDQLLIKSEAKVIHSLTGRISTDDVAHFKAKYPFLQECAYVLKLRTEDSSKAQEKSDQPMQKSLEARGYKTITPDAIRKFYELAYHTAITEKLKSNSINDLFSSKQLICSL